ncbi:MAG: hypothetical protein EAZ53_11780 [Bacteroidetes bacterium]|nr:MAG: hypothetical protein EAZ53_11780 [Bacteroidota bacterium]
MKILFTLGLGVICAISSLQAQTTYTWNNGGPLFGGSGNFQTPTNWVPTRTTPASNDILIFNQGGFIDVSNVPNQTIGAMYLNVQEGLD